MYYQLSYDKIIEAKTFYHKEKNEWLNGLSIYLRFDPIFYTEEEQKPQEQMIQLKNERSLLSRLVRVSYDNRTRKLSFHDHEEIKGKYRVAEYYKLVTDEENSSWCEEEKISKEEFYFLMQHYGQQFRNDSSLQTCSYGWYEIESLSKGMTVQNSHPKHSNQMTKHLEEIVSEEKKRHEHLLSTKTGAMKFEYRSECLAFENQIDSLENHKDFLLNQELFDPEKVLEAYVELFKEWVRFNRFMSQDSLYTS